MAAKAQLGFSDICFTVVVIVLVVVSLADLFYTAEEYFSVPRNEPTAAPA